MTKSVLFIGRVDRYEFAYSFGVEDARTAFIAEEHRAIYVYATTIRPLGHLNIPLEIFLHSDRKRISAEWDLTPQRYMGELKGKMGTLRYSQAIPHDSVYQIVHGLEHKKFRYVYISREDTAYRSRRVKRFDFSHELELGALIGFEGLNEDENYALRDYKAKARAKQREKALKQMRGLGIAPPLGDEPPAEE